MVEATGLENGFGVETLSRAEQLSCFGKWQFVEEGTLDTRLDIA